MVRGRHSADNDFDGDFDCNDADCGGSPDCIENFADGDCSDGADNDRDGLFDCDDPDCADDAACATEDDCTDGADNDLDGLIDCGYVSNKSREVGYAIPLFLNDTPGAAQ